MKFLNNIKQIDFEKWQRLVKESSFASFFQTPECYELYAAQEFMTPFVFAVEEDAALLGVIVGYIQSDGCAVKRFLSRRAIINGGPLLSEDIGDEVLEVLLNGCARELSSRAIYIESRNFADYSKFRSMFEKCGFKYEKHLNFQIDTTSVDIVEENLGKSRKRDVKTSVREGAAAVENPSLEQVREFYALLKKLYKERVKTPLFPLSFFEYLRVQKYGKIILVALGGKIIGGTVCVCLEGKSVYEWFVCGEDGVHKGVYPSTFATYLGILFAAQNGFSKFDMMGAGKPGDGYGVREFKAKFGGELVEHGRFVRVNNKILYNIGKLGVALMKRF